MRPSIPDLFNDEKTDVKTEKNFEKAEVLDWTGLRSLGKKKRYNTKYLKINITKENLQERLVAPNPNKLSSPDCVHPKTFIETRRVFSELLQTTFNEYLKQRKLPLPWREVSVTAIYKNNLQVDKNVYHGCYITKFAI